MPSVLSRLVTKLALKIGQYYYSVLACFYLFWRWIRTRGAALKFKERQMPKYASFLVFFSFIRSSPMVYFRKLLENYTHKYVVLPSGINMHYVEAGQWCHSFFL